jgi:hypothetical protein
MSQRAFYVRRLQKVRTEFILTARANNLAQGFSVVAFYGLMASVQT